MQMIRSLILVVVVAAAAGCSDFATEPDRTPSDLRVSPDTVVLMEGETVAFEVEVLDQDGEPYAAIPSWAPPFWMADDPTLIELGDEGVALGLLAGQSRAVVELAGMRRTAVVRTNPTEIALTVPFAHITQTVQRQEGDVPLIAGRDGLLRVYVQGDGINFFRPVVEATFYNGGGAVHTAELTHSWTGLPDTLDAGELALSYNGTIPGEVIQPGVGMSLEVDPDGTVPATEGSVLRVPASGVAPLDVREVTPFRLTLVPVDQAANGREARFSQSAAERVIRLTEDIFPFGELDLEIREPYVTQAALNTDDGWYQLIEEIAMLRFDDGSDRYYYGGFDRPPGTGIGGLGYVGYPVSIGMDDRPDIIAHELGHNLSLPHAPCGGPARPDSLYPYPSGIVGQYGYGGAVQYRSTGVVYDRTRPTLHDAYSTRDLMSYCDPIWISDYNYEKVLAYRDTSAYDASADLATMAAAEAGERRTLLVRGGVLNGQLRLEPALEWRGRPQLPAAAGPYSLEGLDESGSVLFRLSFAPERIDHGQGGAAAQFLLAVPAEMARVDRLDRLRLTGPEGTVEQRRTRRSFQAVPRIRVERVAAAPGAAAAKAVGRWDASAFPLAVVRDRATGRIRAMSRTGRIALPTADPASFEVFLSDGLATRTPTVVQQ